MIIDEAMVSCLSPVLGEGLVYSNVSPEILERDIHSNFKPFAIFRCAGGENHHILERFPQKLHDGKSNYFMQVEIWGARIGDVRRLAFQARDAIISCPFFLGVYREGGMIDRKEFGNKLFGVFQEFDLWLANP